MFKENKDFKWSVIKDNFLTQDECDKLKNHIKNTCENLGEIPEGIQWKSILYNKGEETDYQWLVDRAWMNFKLANTLHWKFNIDSIKNSKYLALFKMLIV